MYKMKDLEGGQTGAIRASILTYSQGRPGMVSGGFNVQVDKRSHKKSPPLMTRPLKGVG